MGKSTIPSDIRLPGVYLIYCFANCKAYVGSSNKICSRIAQHKCDLRHNKHGNPHLQNAWNLYGEDEFTFGVLQTCDVSEKLVVEQWWLDIWMASGMAFNRHTQAASPAGFKHTDEARKALSIYMKANPPFKGRKHTDESKSSIGNLARERLSTPEANPFFGKTHTKDARDLISQRAMGNTRAAGVFRSAETRAKVSAANKGKRRTPEQCAQMSVTFSGSRNPHFGKTVPQEQKDRATATRAANRTAGLHKS